MCFRGLNARLPYSVTHSALDFHRDVAPSLAYAAFPSLFSFVMASAESSCYTLVFEDPSETPSTSELRTALQKGSDEVKFDTLRKIIVSTINGNPQERSVIFLLGGRSCIESAACALLSPRC